MSKVSRRDVLKTGLLAPAAIAVANGMGPVGIAMQGGGNAPEPHPAGYTAPESSEPDAGEPSAGRERLLLDFGWRFHFGIADDPAKDFEFGSRRSRFKGARRADYR
jgi:beta-galactosidase